MSDKWLDQNSIKGNAFDRRVGDVRRQTQFNLDANAAVEYLKRGMDTGLTSGAHHSVGSFSNDQKQTGGFSPGIDQRNTGSRGFLQPTGTYSQPGQATSSQPFQRHDIVVRDMSEDEIDQKAFFDTLTKAYNLRYMLRCLHTELLRSQQFQRPTCLLVVAIHKFQMIGMDYGALALDAVLYTAAEALMICCRPVDMVARFMEDRFIVMLPETDLHTAAALAEKVRQTFEAVSIPHQWHTIRFQANIGLAEFPTHGQDVESFISLADFACDSVAEAGGNSILLAPSMQ
ncbi:MAG TPA: GGDEF domain-containing protein [Oculatellaceae cyanobacterium]